MKTIAQSVRQSAVAVLSIVAVLCAGCANMTSVHNVQATLGGSQEVPPVTTAAMANASIVVGTDKSVSGSITTSGVVGVAAHIHEGAAGKNGPVIVPMTKTSENVWSIAAGAKFTDAQYDAFMAGNTYVNVHSAANKGGEIRAQLKPQ
jgi:hypothetical protein